MTGWIIAGGLIAWAVAAVTATAVLGPLLRRIRQAHDRHDRRGTVPHGIAAGRADLQLTHRRDQQ